MPGAETKLKSNDEVAILPPVSGGKEGSRTASGGGNRRETAHCAVVGGAIQTQEVLAGIKRGEDGPPWSSKVCPQPDSRTQDTLSRL